ncbi:hypothetical protein V6574_00115 [Streptomyces sp. SM1P]
MIAVTRFLERYPHARLALAPELLEQTASFISNGYTSIAVELS